MRRAHDMPFGAAVVPGAGVRFGLWAPSARSVELCLESEKGERRFPMFPDSSGWCERLVGEARVGMRYAYLIDGELRVPDPATRYQPGGVHGPSEVVDPGAFDWRDEGWKGRPWREAVLYEIHVGAFTPSGTFSGVIDRLDYLADLGVTAVELMPVADCCGGRNWGYDGVCPFAPDSRYGEPLELKRLVQEAHARGLMIFLDVVYNHFGPEGNYLHRYAADFFTDRYRTPWGQAINFDGANSRCVRDFVIHNALYWIEEYNFDGLRLDAVHAICDESDPDILTELASTVRSRCPADRHVHLVLENDRNEARYLERDDGGRTRRYTAQWNDDFHHAVHVLLTGESGGYYADYSGGAARLLGRTLTEGFAYQREASQFRGGARRGEPSAHLPPAAFVLFLQNHDQVGNRAFGERIAALAADGALRTAVALMVLAPSPPLIFMGEEWAASAPFLFFCDFEDGLAERVREGRRHEFAHFPEFADEAARRLIPDPNDSATFEASKLDWNEPDRPPHERWLELWHTLLAVRHREIVPRIPLSRRPCGFDPMGDRSLSVWWSLEDGSTLRAYVNFGEDEVAPRDAAPAAGRCLFASNEDVARRIGEGALPGESAAFFLEDAAD